jgi:catechol 2,3-dioxygenase-like lactoylglutathione lyase family enzyme
VYVPRQLAIWRWTRGAWSFVDSTGPILRGPPRAAYDTKRSVLVVPVVDDSTSRVWEWNGRAWRSIAAPGPPKRTRHAVAFHGAMSRVVLVGGRGEPSREMLGDAWSWDGARWSALPSGPGAPGPRASASLVFDPVSSRLLLFGGVAPGRGPVSDLWLRTGTTWTEWTAPAEPNPSRVEPAFTTRGAFVGISVADIEASVGWYSQKLGLAVVMRPPKVEKSTAVILEGGGLIVELMHHEDAVPLSRAAPAINRNYIVHGIFKAGIVVDDFDKTIATLRARGVQIAIGPFPATAEQRANAIIRDNAGNYIQFFGAR